MTQPILFQYQERAEPPSQDVLSPVGWLGQIAQPLARIVRVALFSESFAFVPVLTPVVVVGSGDQHLVLGQKETFSTGVNPNLGSGALFG